MAHEVLLFLILPLGWSGYQLILLPLAPKVRLTNQYTRKKMQNQYTIGSISQTIAFLHNPRDLVARPYNGSVMTNKQLNSEPITLYHLKTIPDYIKGLEKPVTSDAIHRWAKNGDLRLVRLTPKSHYIVRDKADPPLPEDTDRDYWSVNLVAKWLDVDPKTIRNWEEKDYFNLRETKIGKKKLLNEVEKSSFNYWLTRCYFG